MSEFFSQPGSLEIVFFLGVGVLAINVLMLAAFGVLLTIFLKRLLISHTALELQKEKAYRQA